MLFRGPPRDDDVIFFRWLPGLYWRTVEGQFVYLGSSLEWKQSCVWGTSDRSTAHSILPSGRVADKGAWDDQKAMNTARSLSVGSPWALLCINLRHWVFSLGRVRDTGPSWDRLGFDLARDSDFFCPSTM